MCVNTNVSRARPAFGVVDFRMHGVKVNHQPFPSVISSFASYRSVTRYLELNCVMLLVKSHAPCFGGYHIACVCAFGLVSGMHLIHVPRGAFRHALWVTSFTLPAARQHQRRALPRVNPQCLFAATERTEAKSGSAIHSATGKQRNTHVRSHPSLDEHCLRVIANRHATCRKCR